MWSPFGAKAAASENRAESSLKTRIGTEWDSAGVTFKPGQPTEDWLSKPDSYGEAADLVLALRQLEEEGFVDLAEGSARLAWSDYYKLQESPEHGGALKLLGLPSPEDWRPLLSSREGLPDQGFAVSIEGWVDPDGRRPSGNVAVEGAIITAGKRQALLPEAAWQMVQAVFDHRARRPADKTPDVNRRDWSRIRSHAVRARADMSVFLKKTVVLTPERLRIDLRRGDSTENKLVEVIPGFDGEPKRWLEMFDRLDTIPERYEIPDGAGVVHVLLSPETQAVLREIRRMPGRRIAGDRAEIFVRNPFAMLGPYASNVIDPEQFERAREQAGIVFSRFTARVLRDDSGLPFETSLIVEESFKGSVRAEVLKFEGVDELGRFLKKLESRIAHGSECCHWQGYDLEILGDTPRQVAILQDALKEMQAPRRIHAADIYDLTKYSERVGGFGVEKPYYSPFIAKKSEDAGWFPENVDLGLCFTPEGGGDTVAIALDARNLDSFRLEIEKAKQEKRDTFSFPGCPKAVPMAWAEEALETLGKVREDVGTGSFDPKKASTRGKISERKGLVVKPNVDSQNYMESRGTLVMSGEPAVLPKSMLGHVQLKDHQIEGVAWLQHLWRNSPLSCRGALLADDMGLGKTIQLLTFIAAVIETEPKVDPFLVVAPVSLLENWNEEIGKFFLPGTMNVLTLYGATLASKRVSKSELDEELLRSGAPKLLRAGWLGSAQVVLTTYETLRDLEFSLGSQRWSVMICDEAQKIKNPNAMVTRAAWKQNARLKIACTGTPVENTLTDLWCLFEFFQPGLLGVLKDFGTKYRKPIEAETDEEKALIDELRGLIEPQKLRRTKAEVAKDLPRKIEFQGCRALQLSQRQRSLYADAIAQFRSRGKGQQTGLQSPLGLLQYLRRLCSDPRAPGHLSTASDSVSDLERNSPKMAWMLGHLSEIKTLGEKVIVFCEFRDLQRTLQRAISERFGFIPDVINGDTSADSANANNRQKRIKAFQEAHGFGVIILSPLAVGFGVNIQAANHVIHFTRTWNPAKEDQATDRAYRIGQKKDVHVYYPVVVAHDFLTFDAKLDKLLDKKRSLSADMLNGSGDVSPADFGDLESPDGGNAFGNELISPEDIGSLDPDAFEAFCALLWSKQGYSRTIKTPRSGDGGIDIVAIKGAQGVLIQCKSSSVDDKELGWDAVKDVSAGSAAYAVRFPGIKFSLLAVTNRRFNGTARQQAHVLHVDLMEGADLERLLSLHSMKRGELERFLLSGWAD